MVNSSSLVSNQGIMPQVQERPWDRHSNKYVVIDGQKYPVIKVPDNNPLYCSFAPKYKEVVVIDGKQYDVQEANDIIACDKKKDVVVVDGKQYDVKSDRIGIYPQPQYLEFNPTARINEDSTLAYMA